MPCTKKADYQMVTIVKGEKAARERERGVREGIQAGKMGGRWEVAQELVFLRND